ncbi:hypothetical protein FOVG_19871 [Fusarium oxysporum f. sp. pisi HDV247]|uniref:Uncharacterized protein n=1 Tax=Fusarium oxysporum f. sp. pisi HDV247 TaxID=1080344 RepID=W9N710_FUSOX|nr:hypothetical protein FOVG_19871 [Fusarium oxysporum f. sp. pisi HDV247]
MRSRVVMSAVRTAPSGLDLENSRDLAWIHSKFPGYIGQDCIVLMVPGRRFAVQPDEEAEFLLE